MAELVRMPQAGKDVKTARIVDWLKREDDEVKNGEAIAVVESNKAAFDVAAWRAGVLLKILYPEGEEVEVLTQYPKMNSHVEPDRIILTAAVNVGVAVVVDVGMRP